MADIREIPKPVTNRVDAVTDPPVRSDSAGCGRPVREWALRQGWGGRPVRQEQAHGMLVAALGLLAVHYGLAGRPAA